MLLGLGKDISEGEGDSESEVGGMDGELNDVGGAEPDEEYTLTLSSQSLPPPPEPEEEDTELLRARTVLPIFGDDLGGEPGELTPPIADLPPEFLRCLLPARNSSNRNGLGRRWVRSYKPHLLQTILPGLRVERRHEGGSVVWQLKHLLRKNWVSFEAASSVC